MTRLPCIVLVVTAAALAHAEPDPKLRARADTEDAAGRAELQNNRIARAVGHFIKATRLVPDGPYFLDLCDALDKIRSTRSALEACDAVFAHPASDSVKAKAGEIAARLHKLLDSSVTPSTEAAPVYPGYGIGPFGIGMSRAEVDATHLAMTSKEQGWLCVKSQPKSDVCVYNLRLVNDRIAIIELELHRATAGATFGPKFLSLRTSLPALVTEFHCEPLDAGEGGSSAHCGDGFSVTKGSAKDAGPVLRQE